MTSGRGDMGRLAEWYLQFCWTLGQALFFLGPVVDLIRPLLGLLPLVLIAVAAGTFNARQQPEKASQTLRFILISQPLIWMVACAIFNSVLERHGDRLAAVHQSDRLA